MQEVSKEKSQNGLLRFLEQNAWGLIIALIALVSFYTLTNYRLAQAEQRMSEYPSMDYFELKFSVIDKQLDDLDRKITLHK